MEYKKAYYSVPPEHVGRQVWVRGDSKLLHIYTLLMRQIAVHTLVDAGRFATDQAHVSSAWSSRMTRITTATSLR